MLRKQLVKREERKERMARGEEIPEEQEREEAVMVI